MVVDCWEAKLQAENYGSGELVESGGVEEVSKRTMH